LKYYNATALKDSHYRQGFRLLPQQCHEMHTVFVLSMTIISAIQKVGSMISCMFATQANLKNQ